VTGLDEAYQRLHRTGPEWGEDQLTNHGPMAAEVLVRRGYAEVVGRWVDRYVRRLDDLPAAGDRIGDDDWVAALGDGRRIGDWTAYFERQVAERPWRETLAVWWPRLLPGIAAGTTHGVIRVGHVVRALLAGAETPQSLGELANGLAFWAARYSPVPGIGREAPAPFDPAAALDALPRIPDQHGPVAHRFGQLTHLPGAPRIGPEKVKTALADLVDAATVRYLRYGHAAPVLLVHTATAPNAVLHTLPALDPALWQPSLAAVWPVSAAIHAGWAPAGAAPRDVLPAAPEGPDAAAEVVRRAVDNGDEHVIKFTDTAVEVHARTGDPDALAAAVHIGNLLGRDHQS